jgi:transcriptional regulator with XRE-family HTH domain
MTLREYIDRAGLTQTEMAELMTAYCGWNVGQPEISKWCTGRRSMSLGTQKAFAQLCKELPAE